MRVNELANTIAAYENQVAEITGRLVVSETESWYIVDESNEARLEIDLTEVERSRDEFRKSLGASTPQMMYRFYNCCQHFATQYNKPNTITTIGTIVNSSKGDGLWMVTNLHKIWFRFETSTFYFTISPENPADILPPGIEIIRTSDVISNSPTYLGKSIAVKGIFERTNGKCCISNFRGNIVDTNESVLLPDNFCNKVGVGIIGIGSVGHGFDVYISGVIQESPEPSFPLLLNDVYQFVVDNRFSKMSGHLAIIEL
jgi:hypothetical protein